MLNQQGFIELLIALATIFAIASILVVNLLMARNKAHDAAALIYGREMLTHVTAWLANDPAHKVSNLQTDCLSAVYVAQGADVVHPVSVSECVVQNLGANAYGVQVTARTGNVFQLRN